MFLVYIFSIKKNGQAIFFFEIVLIDKFATSIKIFLRKLCAKVFTKNSYRKPPPLNLQGLKLTITISPGPEEGRLNSSYGGCVERIFHPGGG